uniref:Uncharacterized protein n=1 Tax=Arundo donax TaxID=35708 RepID=A0A0A9C7I0_ARUDO
MLYNSVNCLIARPSQTHNVRVQMLLKFASCGSFAKSNEPYIPTSNILQHTKL